MANCHKNFYTAQNSFHSNIKLDSTKENYLKVSAKSLRAHIRKKFQEAGRPSIKFKVQGSMALQTTVNPLSGEYDIDDGLYFKPQLEERPSPETVHSWVVIAASTYATVSPPIDKKRCVRVPFQAEYHIDIPIYDLVEGEYDDENEPYLAIKEDGWQYSDPGKFNIWFLNRVSEVGNQLRRIVRYFKAWADFQSQTGQTKMPSGLILTILTGKYYNYSDRDDESFALTASSIFSVLSADERILNPVDSSEDLRQRLTDQQFENFMDKLDTLILNADSALDLEDSVKAASLWIKVLGDRFPIVEDDPSSKKKAVAGVTSPGILKTGSKSA